MEDLNETITVFLALLNSAASGSQVKFSINYYEGHILISSASSGFIKELYKDPKVCAHLVEGGIKLNRFK